MIANEIISQALFGTNSETKDGNTQRAQHLLGLLLVLCVCVCVCVCVQAARQYRDERGEIVTKHNSKLAGHRNAQKLVDLTVRTQSCLVLPCLVLSCLTVRNPESFNSMSL